MCSNAIQLRDSGSCAKRIDIEIEAGIIVSTSFFADCSIGRKE
ncbi:MAG: hypothetical protein ACYDHC_05220 [Desulfuromonadaceae bacterium]